MHKLRAFFGCVLLVLARTAFAASPQPVAAEHGMVVTAHRLASEVGVEVLKQGGNAVDAAVAVGYALAVVYPQAGNIGGGGFMTLRLADGRTTFLDFRERAPMAATRTMYLDPAGKVVPGRSTEGFLAVGVPGTVMGLETARERYGRLSRAALLAPAIRLARDGFVLGAEDAASIARSSGPLARDAAAAAVFLKPDGSQRVAGERWSQPDLAATLAAIAQNGPDVFYQGVPAERIVAASQEHGGILAREDFSGYRVRELKPVTCHYRGYEIESSPPPSSGGVILCEILNVLEGFPLDQLGFHSAGSVHAMVEAMRYAYVDRNTRLGDPDFVQNPVAHLTDKAYAAEIRAKIQPGRAGQSAALMPRDLESHETTHFSIVDGEGNAVAVTYTLNGSFGAHVVAAGTGVLLNNEMDDFTARPGTPNLYGLVQGEANAVAPRKTPLSSMSPTIVSRDGKPFMVIGSPGGSRIITIVLEAILNVIDHGMTIQEAIDAPRLHHQWLPDVVAVEPRGLSPDTEHLLADMGYHVGVDPDWPVWGAAAGILVGGPSLKDRLPSTTPHAPRYFGAMDSRAPSGAALGY